MNIESCTFISPLWFKENKNDSEDVVGREKSDAVVYLDILGNCGEPPNLHVWLCYPMSSVADAGSADSPI